MSTQKTLLGLAILLVVLWLLYPTRVLDPDEAAWRAKNNVIEISYMGPGGLQAGSTMDAIKEFEKWSDQQRVKDPKQPIYRVVSGQNASKDMVADPTRFLVACAGGAPPDVVFFDRFAVAEWAARGAFYPLDEFIERDQKSGIKDPPTPTKERYFEAAWNEAVTGGKIFAIPCSIDNRAMFYNKNKLVKARLVDEKGEAKPPKNWDELRFYTSRLSEYQPEKPETPVGLDEKAEYRAIWALARTNGDATKLSSEQKAGVPDEHLQKLSAWVKERKLTCAGFMPNFGNSFLYIFSWMNGGEFMSADGKTCTLNDKVNADALQFMKDIYDDLGGYGKVSGFQSGFQTGELDPFIQGKIAMKVDGYWILRNMGNYGPDVNFGVSTPPMPQHMIDKGKDKISWTGGWSYVIPKNAKNKEAAWAFIRFMSSKKALDIINESDRSLAEAQGQLYIPIQHPVVEYNTDFATRYAYNNPNLDEKFKAGIRAFNELLPYSRYRPVTAVGQRLWNSQLNAFEKAMYDETGTKLQSSLDDETKVVQRDLDQVLHPLEGTPIESWNFFFVLYPVLLLILGFLVYRWDTKLEFRRKLARIFKFSDKKADNIVEGAGGGYFRSQWLGGVVCASPWLIGFIVFGGGPMLFSLIISFCEYDILKPPTFVGVHNYSFMFKEDGDYFLSLSNTIFMALGVPLGMIVGLAIALLLNMKIRGMALWRTFFYLPSIVPAVAASLLWVAIFNPQFGLINRFLSTVGLPEQLWLQSPELAKPSLILMGLWGAGGGMVVWLAGLKSIDPSLYEAAEVDGASEWQKLWNVTIPQLTPYIFFNLVMGMIGVFQVFNQAFLMTQGGPKKATTFYVYHLFNNAFRFGHMGYAAAMAWVLLVIVLILTWLQFKGSKRWVHYESD